MPPPPLPPPAQMASMDKNKKKRLRSFCHSNRTVSKVRENFGHKRQIEVGGKGFSTKNCKTSATNSLKQHRQLQISVGGIDQRFKEGNEQPLEPLISWNLLMELRKQPQVGEIPWAISCNLSHWPLSHGDRSYSITAYSTLLFKNGVLRSEIVKNQYSRLSKISNFSKILPKIIKQFIYIFS